MIEWFSKPGRRRCAISVALAAPCTPLTANIFSAERVDPRVYVAPAAPDWPLLLPVGTIESKFGLADARKVVTAGPGMGTAFIVSPCYALTNYHVVFGTGHAIPDPMTEYPVLLRFGFGGGGPAEFTSGRARIWGALGPARIDVALIRMDRCLGTRLGWYDLATAEKPTAADVIVSMPSFSSDRSMRQLSIQRSCAIHGSDPGSFWIEHDCATRDGASGAPLLVAAAGVPRVIGMNAGEVSRAAGIQPHYLQKLANLAVSMRSLTRLPGIERVLERDIADAKTANPLLAPAADRTGTLSLTQR